MTEREIWREKRKEAKNWRQLEKRGICEKLAKKIGGKCLF